jgi:hypothetical protein
MATYYSDQMAGDVPYIHRAAKQGGPLEVTAVVRFALGTVIGASDVIKILRVGENQKIDSITIHNSADLDPSGTAIAGTLGTIQAVDKDGDAVVVDAKTGTTYTSGAGDADCFVVSASGMETVLETAGTHRYVSGQAGLDNEFAADPGYLSAPQDIALTMTGAGTALAAESFLRFTVKLSAKEATQGEFTGALATAYRNRYNSSGSSQGLKS